MGIFYLLCNWWCFINCSQPGCKNDIVFIVCTCANLVKTIHIFVISTVLCTSWKSAKFKWHSKYFRNVTLQFGIEKLILYSLALKNQFILALFLSWYPERQKQFQGIILKSVKQVFISGMMTLIYFLQSYVQCFMWIKKRRYL